MGNIFQSAKFILELRSSASPNYEQDPGDNTARYWHGLWLVNVTPSWPLIGWHRDIIIRGSDSDRLCDIDTRLEYFGPNIKIETGPVTTSQSCAREDQVALITQPTLVEKIKHGLDCCLSRQEGGTKFLAQTVKCSNCYRATAALPHSLRAEIFPDKKVDDTVSLLCGHNLKMIIIIKAIIGFEISFWTGFFQIPQFDTAGGWLTREWPAWTTLSSRSRDHRRWQEQNDPQIHNRPNKCSSYNPMVSNRCEHFWWAIDTWPMIPGHSGQKQ